VIVTVSLELSDPDVSRPFIEAANPTHPSLLDPKHQLDALFGVVNIPNVIWIDETGMIVRPPEPGWPPGDGYPDWLQGFVDDRNAAVEKRAADIEQDDPELAARLRGGQNRETYADAIRDWARNGAESSFAMTPSQFLEASTERGVDKSEGAAHFELANHLWTTGDRESAINHFNQAHRLQPDNWTYKRQAWSLVGNENAGGGDMGRFNQGPLPGAEADWPFDGNFAAESSTTPASDYYPSTL
jgi:tetratricopeptide (TPR) repeat protein